MIIVISSEETISNEAKVVNQLFLEGLDLFHVRKPFLNDHEMKGFLNQINESFWPQLVLHSHFELAKEYGISRLHFRESDRINGSYQMYVKENMISTSVHGIDTFNALGQEWEYAFVSPFFPSISKRGYGNETTILEDSKASDNPNVKLVALGGITDKNMKEALRAGADGVALLGAIWQSENPLEIFQRCRENKMNY